MTEYGPWIGVHPGRQKVCAVEGCTTEGVPQICPYDGASHHHGCIHYECEAAENDRKRSGLVFRKNGWCWLCPGHYKTLTGLEPMR